MEPLSDDKKDKLKKFVKFVKKELDIITMPKIQILNGRGSLKTTANYNYNDVVKVVKVNGKNRALVDVMRSIAHELVHHKQFEQGRLKNSIEDGADGSEIENEANAKAGMLIRIYTKLNSEIYDDIN